MSEDVPDLSRPYPPEWPVRRALAAYLGENGFTTDEYDADRVHVTFWWLTFPFPNPPSRKIAIRLHDLHHVVTGYGTDPTGEAEISMWELRRGISMFSVFVQGIIWTGALFGLVHSPRRTVAAWRGAIRGQGAGLQPACRRRYEELMELTVGELRGVYGVDPQGVAGARALHGGAPG